MLRVNPNDRLDCSQLLEVLDKCKPGLEVAQEPDNYSLMFGEENDHDMLATINLPKDLKMLERRLPKSNYAKKNSQKLRNMLEQDQSEGSRVTAGNYVSEYGAVRNPVITAVPVEITQNNSSVLPGSSAGYSEIPNYHDNQREYHDSLAAQINSRGHPYKLDAVSRVRREYQDDGNIFQRRGGGDRIVQNQSVMENNSNKLSLQQRIQLINSQHSALVNQRNLAAEQGSRNHGVESASQPRKASGLGDFRTPGVHRKQPDEYSVVLSANQLPSLYSRELRGSRKQPDYTPKPEWWG